MTTPPLPSGYTLSNTPPLPQGYKLAESSSPQEETGLLAGIKRGVSNIASLPSSVYHAFTDEPKPGEPGAGQPQDIAQKASLGVRRLLIEPQAEQYRQAQQETAKPGDTQWNNATERAHAHMIAAAVPVVGPLAENLAQRWLSGDKEGAAAELATYMVAPKIAEKTAEVAPGASQAAVRGAAKTANAAIENAPKVLGTIGGVSGFATGAMKGSVPGAILGGTFGGYEGTRLGNYIAKSGIKVPGEDFGLPSKYPPMVDAGGAQRAPVVGPKPIPPPQPNSDVGAVQDARAYFQQKLAQRKAQLAAPAPEPTPAPATMSVADQTDIAKALGFKSLAAAKLKFGEEGWQRVATPPKEVQKAVSDVVEQVAPAAPLETKVAIDKELQKGNVDKAQSLLEDAKKSTPLSDLEDDQAVKASMQADLDKQGFMGQTVESRLRRVRESADYNKGSLFSPEQAVNALPLPWGTMEANKLLGYEGRRTIPEATQIRKEAMQPKMEVDAPWGGYTKAAKQFVKKNSKPTQAQP